MYEALRGSSCADFDKNFVVWLIIQEPTGTVLGVGELLDKAKLDYRGMMHLGNWVLSGKATSVIPRKDRYDKDIATLLATSKSQAKHISKLTKSATKAKDANKSFSSLTRNCTKPKTPNGSLTQNSHSSSNQYGPVKDFQINRNFLRGVTNFR